MNIRTDILLRVYLSFGAMVFFAIAVLYKMFSLQVVQGTHWQAMADSLSTRYQTIEATRGNIFSADGSLLATSVPEYDVRMDMLAPGILEDDMFYSKVDSLAAALAVFFQDKSADQYRRLLRKARKDKSRYFLVKRNVSFQDMKAVRSFPIFKLGKYKGGLIAEQKNKRILPFKSLAARTIGYKNDNVQPVGLEGAYSEYMDGISGSRLVQRIAGGSWMPINEDTEVSPKDGADIISTIDINMQDIAQKALEKQLMASDADNGCVILMEVATGEVRAVANFTRVGPETYQEKFNYAVAQSAEPGSTFKLASYLIALKDGKIDTADLIDTRGGTFTVHRKVIKDDHQGGYGLISVKRAFEVSSNTAITKLIYQHYKDSPAAFTKGLRDLHLNDKLGLQIPGEGSPLVKTPSNKSWNGLSLTQMAYGYELLQTPLQTLVLYNAVANNGKMIAPLFVREVRRLGNTVEKFDARVIDEQIASEDVIKKLQGMLEGTVQQGTGKGLKNSLFKIAGKTGTAQMANGAAGYKGVRRYQASFAGYFPAEQPKYSMIVVVQNPRRGYYAASVAGPVFKEVAEKVYASDNQMYHDFSGLQFASVSAEPTAKSGFQKDSQYVFQALGLKNTPIARPDTAKALISDDDIEEGKVPDLKGMGLKDAVYLLGNVGVKTFVKGKGRVIRQSLHPGEAINKGASITIELE